MKSVIKVYVDTEQYQMLFELPNEILYKIVLYDIETYRSAFPVIGHNVDIRYAMGYFALDTHIAKYQRCMDEIRSIDYSITGSARTSRRKFKSCVYYSNLTNTTFGKYVSVLTITHEGYTPARGHYVSQQYALIDDGSCKHILDLTISDWNAITRDKINIW